MALIVLVTIPKKNAHILAKKILQKRLCACVNIIPEIASYFWWKGKIEREKESLLVMKTKDVVYPKLKKMIQKHHPYDVPEIVGVKIDKINEAYQQWLLAEVKNG